MSWIRFNRVSGWVLIQFSKSYTNIQTYMKFYISCTASIFWNSCIKFQRTSSSSEISSASAAVFGDRRNRFSNLSIQSVSWAIKTVRSKVVKSEITNLCDEYEPNNKDDCQSITKVIWITFKIAVIFRRVFQHGKLFLNNCICMVPLLDEVFHTIFSHRFTQRWITWFQNINESITWEQNTSLLNYRYGSK